MINQVEYNRSRHGSNYHTNSVGVSLPSVSQSTSCLLAALKPRHNHTMNMSCLCYQCLVPCVAVLLGISMSLPPANAAVDCSGSPSLKTVIYNKDKSVKIIWNCITSGGSSVYSSIIERYQSDENSQDASKVYIATHDFIKKETFKASNLYELQVKTSGNNTNIELTISDVKKQINNKDGSQVNVMKYEYVFICTLTYTGGKFSSKEIKLRVYEKPTITAAPRSQQINEAYKNVKLRCNAIGKPKPAIAWNITKGRQAYNKVGPEIVINLFTKDDVGVYKCVARNSYGEDTAEASLHYTYCGSGCSSTDIAIKMTKLNYDDGYDYEDSVNYRNLKENIETACLRLYTLKAESDIYSCVVTKLRRGSVIANIKQTYSTGTSDPDKPLRQAIKTGKFAGFEVSFVGVVTSPKPSTPPPTGPKPSTPPPTVTVTTQLPSTTPQTVLGLLGFSLLVNVILTVYILRKKAPSSLINRNREASNEDIDMNIVHQNFNQSESNENEGFTDEQNQSTQTASTPVYQFIEPGHSGTEYSSLSLDTKITPVEPTLLSSQSQAKTQNSVSTSVYEAIQPRHSDLYSSLSSDTKITPSKPSLPSSENQVNTENSGSTPVYQSIQPVHSGTEYSSLSPDTKITTVEPTLPSSENQVDTENSGSTPVYQSIQPDHSGAVYSSLSPDTRIPDIDI